VVRPFDVIRGADNRGEVDDITGAEKVKSSVLVERGELIVAEVELSQVDP